MSPRDAILRAVRANRPAAVALPVLDALGGGDGADRVERFTAAVARNGGAVVLATEAGVATAVEDLFPDAAEVVWAMAGADARSSAEAARPHDLADVDVLVCRGVLGVAENGAVWVPASRIGHRAAPFLTQHLVLALGVDEIVDTLHDAYRRVDVAAEGFGLFVAGPSKTADIEQSLVIGAHGARSLTVLLLEAA